MTLDRRALVEALDQLVGYLDAHRPAYELGAAATPLLTYYQSLSVVNRLDDSFALLRDGTGATVLGALARSLLEQAVLEIWMQQFDPTRESRLVWLNEERRRLRELIEQSDVVVPNIDRWLRPIPEDALAVAATGTSAPDLQQDLARRVGDVVELVLKMPASVADLLAMSGHANYAAAMCTVAPAPHPVGFEATDAYASIFTQAASASALAASGGWLATEETLREGHALLTRVLALTEPAHRLPSPSGSTPQGAANPSGKPSTSLQPSPSWLSPPRALDELLHIVLARGSEFLAVLHRGPNPFLARTGEPVNLTSALPYLTALSTCEVALRGCHGYLSGAAAATAARMLLEEASRSRWQWSGLDDAEMRRRYVAIADAATQGRDLFRQRLKAAGAADAALGSLFNPLPDSPPLAIDRRRTPANEKSPKAGRPIEHLLDLGSGYPEPAWLSIAYSLLSQVVHATPLGDLHLQARRDSDVTRLSHEMTALAADAACTGVATIVVPLGAVLSVSHGLEPVDTWAAELRAAAATVHDAARLVHFLD